MRGVGAGGQWGCRCLPSISHLGSSTTPCSAAGDAASTAATNTQPRQRLRVIDSLLPRMTHRPAPLGGAHRAEGTVGHPHSGPPQAAQRASDAPRPLHPCIPGDVDQAEGQPPPATQAELQGGSQQGQQRGGAPMVFMARTEVADSSRQRSCVASATCCGADTGVVEEFLGVPCSEEEPALPAQSVNRQLLTSGIQMPIVPRAAGHRSLKRTCRRVLVHACAHTCLHTHLPACTFILPLTAAVTEQHQAAVGLTGVWLWV